jgi:hypothetical protein
VALTTLVQEQKTSDTCQRPSNGALVHYFFKFGIWRRVEVRQKSSNGMVRGARF